MDTIKPAIEVLRRSEADLREMLSKAASAGDYEIVLRLTSLAKAIAELIVIAKAPSGVTKKAHSAVTRSLRKGTRSKSRRRITAPPGYPRFLRRGDDLVKIGWSKRAKKEYQHKVPRRVLTLVVVAISKMGSNRQLFTTDDFMPVADPDESTQVPGYQTYLCLAWLRHEGLVEQHGRQGYSLPNVADLDHAVEAAWNRLPECCLGGYNDQ